MSRSRPLNHVRPNDHLVATDDGSTIWASDARFEQFGPRKGALVHVDDLDEPGRLDLPQHYRSEQAVSPVAEASFTWEVYDGNGDIVTGGPADV